MIHERELFLFVLALMLAAPVAAGSIERAVEPSGNGLDITLTVTDIPVGGIVETLSDGCTWIETDHPADRTRVSGQHIAFAVIGEETIRYHVQGPSENAERFAGIWEDYHTLTGASGSVGADEPQTSETETTQNSSVLATETDAVPCDRDGDGTVTDSELATAILDSLDARFMGGTDEAPSVVDLQDAVFVIEHWKGQALTITESAGQTKTVTRPLRRIVAFNPYVVKTMRLLGIEPDRIVGVPDSVIKDSVLYPEYHEKPDVGGSSSPNYEQVVILHPDTIVFLSPWTESGESTNAEIKKKLGSIDPSIRFFTLDCASFQHQAYANDVQVLGLLLGKEEEADRYLAFHGNVLDTVTRVVDKIPDEDQVSVYIEYHSSDYSTGTEGSTYNTAVTLAGGRNILADSPVKYPTVDPEEVVARNPDVIIKMVRGNYNDENRSATIETVHRLIMNRTGWDHINAIRDGRMYVIDTSFIVGNDQFIGVAYMAKWFYPDLFPDLDPKAIHQQYLNEFLRIDYDLDEHPAFVYPT